MKQQIKAIRLRKNVCFCCAKGKSYPQFYVLMRRKKNCGNWHSEMEDFERHKFHRKKYFWDVGSVIRKFTKHSIIS